MGKGRRRPRRRCASENRPERSRSRCRSRAFFPNTPRRSGPASPSRSSSTKKTGSGSQTDCWARRCWSRPPPAPLGPSGASRPPRCRPSWRTAPSWRRTASCSLPSAKETRWRSASCPCAGARSRYCWPIPGTPTGRRAPDIPAGAPLLYQLQLLDVSDKADPLNLPLSDRIRAGNRKRERGNFHFQREEYGKAARAYRMALDVLTTDEREVRHYRVKCLNNLAAALLKLERRREALRASRDVLALQPDNVKALYRAGKQILSDASDYGEAAELLKKALKLEPAARAIHAELSKLVKRQSGGKAARHRNAKPAEMSGDDVAPFLLPSGPTSPISWKLIVGALLVALGSFVTSLVLTARN
uniref:Peptidyl-prolyl cis-trans isomerase FKBP8-like n=1 Tax=Hippocampus comes TaxID=109280 RepID=A0A3Q2XXA8_HIPCM